jgi:actin-like ATPase involved in cell morphogenesis
MWIGIDFGTSNSCAALVVDDTARPVVDPVNGSSVFPSSVYIEPDGQVLVGQLAENMWMYDVRRYQRAFKLRLGQKELFSMGEHQKHPIELVAEVLKKLKSEAEQQITHSSLTDAVITVPARYEAPLRDLMRQAAQGAGFERIEILGEPVAAAVYYAAQVENRVQDGETFLVYDLGGGTFDATLVCRDGLRYELLGAPDGRQIGGEDFDDYIYADFMAQCPPAVKEQLLQPQYRSDRLRIGNLCREIKHTLSETHEVSRRMPILGQVVNYKLSRRQFVSMIEDSIEETITCCEGLLRRANIESSKVRCVLLVGGSCRIPYIRERLKQRLNIDVFPVDEPELAVSMGAAFYGDALDRAVDFVNEVDVLCTAAQFHEALNRHLPELFESLAQPLARGIAHEAVAPALRSWQRGWTTTLNGIQPDIERHTKAWINSTACQDAIRQNSIAWVKKRIPELSSLSDPICDRYHVSRAILRLPKSIPQLEAGLPNTPVGGSAIDTDAVSSWVTVIVAVVMGIIVAHLHFLAALAGPVGFIVALAAIYYGKGKTEEIIREANLPKWSRSLMLSDEKINTQVGNVQATLATSIVGQLEKNKADFGQFVNEIQRILKETMHEQAVREARLIWLHTEEEGYALAS